MRPFLVASFFLLPAGAAFAQKHTEEFQFSRPEKIIAGSLYNHIGLLDLREDTTNIGVIQTGGFNRQTRLIPNPALRKQLAVVLGEMTNPAKAAAGELLLRLRQFRVSEVTAGLSEVGYCVVQAELLALTNNGYQILATLDKALEVRGKMDVTKATIEKANTTLLTFLSKNLEKQPAGGPFYTFAEVVKLDSIQKRNVPLYNLTAGFTNGLYDNYEQFAVQKPNGQIIAEEKDGQLYKVRTVETDGNKPEKIKPGYAYAIVYEGVPYIGTDYGFYQLRKEGDDFLFTGQVKATPATAGVIAASVFGLVGALVASAATSKDAYELKLDYRNGSPIFVRRAP